MSYRESPLQDSAVGTVERIDKWGGKTYGGRVPSFLGLAERTGGLYLEGDAPMTVEEGLASLPDLDYEVKLEPLTVQLRDERGRMGKRLELPRHFATVLHYADGRDPVAVAPVGTRYEPIQIRDGLSFGDEIVREGEGFLKALGVYGDPIGARAYAAFDMGRMLVGGEDRHDLYVVVTTSHDGSSGLSVRIVPLRFRCTNETSMHYGRRSTRYTIRHMRGAHGRVQEAREILKLTFDARDAYAAKAEELLRIRVTPDQFRLYGRQVFGIEEADEKLSKRALHEAYAKDEELLAILASETNDFGRGTAYAAYQAIVEDLDWVSRVYGAKSAEDATVRRWNRSMNGQLDATKNRAWDLAFALA